MEDMGRRIAELRKSFGLNQQQLAGKLNVSSSTIAMWETNKRAIKDEDLVTIATFFDVSTDYLLGRTDKKHYYDLTEKDERDIAKELEQMIEDLSKGGAMAFSKDESEFNKETRELLIASLENSLRFAKIEAKKKFTPKKYRD